MADSKITGLTADTTPTSDDLVVTVNDPAGTPANKKVTLANMFTAINGTGILANRQGGTTGDATWQTAGTSNTDTSAKRIIMQAGCVTSSGAGGLTVTFPAAFNQIPLIFCTVDSGSNGFWAQHESVSTSQFTLTCWSATGTLAAKNVNWLAIGQ